MKYIYLTIALLSFSLASYGANWKNIKGTDIYLDLDSISKQGDIVMGMLNDNEPVIIDCKRKVYVYEKRWVSITENTNINNIYDTLCKKPWEVWK